MPNTSGLAVKVGIFAIIALVLLIGFSLQVTDGFGRNGRYQVNAYFEDASGLANGADVSLGGVVIGEVTEMAFDPERKLVRAALEIKDDYPLPADSVAAVEKSALLGNGIVVVEYGMDEEIIAPEGEIATRRVPGLNELVAEVSEMSAEAKELISGFKDSQNQIFGQLETMIDENREDIRKTTQSMAEAGPKLEKLATELTQISEDVRAGKGTVGKLFTDDQLYTDLKTFTQDARQITTDIREGDGTLSRLVYDDSLILQAEASMAKVGEASEQINVLLEGKEEDLDKLITSLSEVGPKLDQAMADINAISSKINEGEGTLGMLVNDPELYKDTKRAVNQVTESFEQTEEQGIIRSFVGVLFGAMI